MATTFSTIPTPPPTTYDVETEEQECQNVQQKQRLWDWLKKLRRDEQTTPSNDSQKPDTPPQTPARPAFGRKTSKKKVGVGIPRSTTFRRQEEEQRKNLEPVEAKKEKDKRDVSAVRQRALSAEPKPTTSKHPRRELSAPDLGYHGDAYQSMDGCLQRQDFANMTFDDQQQVPPPSPPPSRPLPDADLDDEASLASFDTNFTDDEEFLKELEQKWILNLSMHFRDKSPREKFFVTFAEQPQKWRRVTVSCDYRNAETDSLEADLQAMSSQREKSSRIYESLRGSLTDIQFYDTVTNLKLETRDERLHVHVTEDVNEIIAYPSIQSINHLTHIKRYRESELHFQEHMSGFVYKVDVEGKTWIKKEIPGPDSVDEFLYEVNALSSLVGAGNVIQLQGLVISEDGQTVKGLLIEYAEKNALVDIIYDNRGALPWARRERWAKQIIKGLSEIHEAGFVQGDFTLSNIVIDGNDEAKIIDINRRGCPVGWEPPEITALIDSAQRISMFIGVKSDLFQLGMVLWGLAREEDEPERQPRPLSFENAPEEVAPYYRDLVGRCLNPNPTMRLSGKDLLKEFPASVILHEKSISSFPELKPAQQQLAVPIVTGNTFKPDVRYPERLSTPDLNGNGEVTTSISRSKPKQSGKIVNGERGYTGMLFQSAEATERQHSNNDVDDYLSAPPIGERAASNAPLPASSTPNRSLRDPSPTKPDTFSHSPERHPNHSPVRSVPSRGRLPEPETQEPHFRPHIPPTTNQIPISPQDEPNWEDLTNGPTPYLIHRDTLDSFDSDTPAPALTSPPHPRRTVYHATQNPFNHVDSGLADIEPETPRTRTHIVRRSLEDEGRTFQHVDSGLADMHFAHIGGNEGLSFKERARMSGFATKGVDLEGILGVDLGDVEQGPKEEGSEQVGETSARGGMGVEMGVSGAGNKVATTMA